MRRVIEAWLFVFVIVISYASSGCRYGFDIGPLQGLCVIEM